MRTKIEIFMIEEWSEAVESQAGPGESPVGVGPSDAPRQTLRSGHPPCPFVVIVDGKSTGRMAWDEMLGTVAKLTLGLKSHYPMRSRGEVSAMARRSGERTIEEAREEVNRDVSRRIAEDFPE